MNGTQLIALIVGGAWIYGVLVVKLGAIPTFSVWTYERPDGFDTSVVEERGETIRILLGALLAVALAVTVWLLRGRPGERLRSG